MSAIEQALHRLDGSLNTLETALGGLERNLAEHLSGQQRDMFGYPEASNQNIGGIDASVVAKRLDIAIEKVEEILSEAAAG
ncbi:MAG: hypothetical protein ACPGRX_03565 [Bdellovibrionales bacterium]